MKVFSERQSPLLETIEGFEYFLLFVLATGYMYLYGIIGIRTSKRT